MNILERSSALRVMDFYAIPKLIIVPYLLPWVPRYNLLSACLHILLELCISIDIYYCQKILVVIVENVKN